MRILDPLAPDEERQALAVLSQFDGTLVEGTLAPDTWQDAAVIRRMGHDIFENRLAELTESLPDRIAHADHPDNPRDRTSSAAFHRPPSMGGPEFDTFLAQVIRPVFLRNHPLAEQMQLARQIITLHDQSRVGYRDDILGPQFAEIAATGLASGRNRQASRRLVVPTESLRLIVHLGNQTAPSSPHPGLWIVSYIRLNGTSRSDHFRGLGLDLLRFGGHRIHMQNPETAFQGVVALIRALPAGRYQLGLPRVPESREIPHTPPLGDEYDHTATYLRDGTPAAPAERTQDRRQFPQFYDENGQLRPEYAGGRAGYRWQGANPFLDRRLREGHSPGGIRQDLNVFENPAYRRRFEAAVVEAGTTGAVIEDLFPDKPNHLHISIRQ
ncbi:hypothetical protein [Yoonia sp. SS1-5]|uniref:Uncharacterized protein n=1 Tax=Yoonia rhodophyticola TaxID=3137370 RepID=A0AAN0MB98_9RHOB